MKEADTKKLMAFAGYKEWEGNLWKTNTDEMAYVSEATLSDWNFIELAERKLIGKLNIICIEIIYRPTQQGFSCEMDYYNDNSHGDHSDISGYGNQKTKSEAKKEAMLDTILMYLKYTKEKND